MNRIYLVIIATLFMGGCAVSRQTPAPIVNGTVPSAVAVPTATVAPSSTAASAASTNDTTAPVTTTISKAGDDEDSTVVSTPVTSKPVKATPVAVPVAADTTSATLGGVNWLKPTSGKIIQPYTVATKGVDVQGKEGQDIVAAYGGTVAYSGSGLKGYGNLVIIKHAGNYLTAYSHNKLNLVKEGDTVKRGQKIAELGKTESDRPLLHFELRKSGKPIDPTPIFNGN